MENETQTLYNLEYGEKTENQGNEKHTVGFEIWRETLKNENIRNAHCRTYNMARNQKR